MEEGQSESALVERQKRQEASQALDLLRIPLNKIKEELIRMGVNYHEVGFPEEAVRVAHILVDHDEHHKKVAEVYQHVRIDYGMSHWASKRLVEKIADSQMRRIELVAWQDFVDHLLVTLTRGQLEILFDLNVHVYLRRSEYSMICCILKVFSVIDVDFTEEKWQWLLKCEEFLWLRMGAVLKMSFYPPLAQIKSYGRNYLDQIGMKPIGEAVAEWAYYTHTEKTKPNMVLALSSAAKVYNGRWSSYLWIDRDNVPVDDLRTILEERNDPEKEGKIVICPKGSPWKEFVKKVGWPFVDGDVIVKMACGFGDADWGEFGHGLLHERDLDAYERAILQWIEKNSQAIVMTDLLRVQEFGSAYVWDCGCTVLKNAAESPGIFAYSYEESLVHYFELIQGDWRDQEGHVIYDPFMALGKKHYKEGKAPRKHLVKFEDSIDFAEPVPKQIKEGIAYLALGQRQKMRFLQRVNLPWDMRTLQFCDVTNDCFKYIMMTKIPHLTDFGMALAKLEYVEMPKQKEKIEFEYLDKNGEKVKGTMNATYVNYMSGRSELQNQMYVIPWSVVSKKLRNTILNRLLQVLPAAWVFAHHCQRKGFNIPIQEIIDWLQFAFESWDHSNIERMADFLCLKRDISLLTQVFTKVVDPITQKVSTEILCTLKGFTDRLKFAIRSVRASDCEMPIAEICMNVFPYGRVRLSTEEAQQGLLEVIIDCMYGIMSSPLFRPESFNPNSYETVFFCRGKSFFVQLDRWVVCSVRPSVIDFINDSTVPQYQVGPVGIQKLCREYQGKFRANVFEAYDWIAMVTVADVLFEDHPHDFGKLTAATNWVLIPLPPGYNTSQRIIRFGWDCYPLSVLKEFDEGYIPELSYLWFRPRDYFKDPTDETWKNPNDFDEDECRNWLLSGAKNGDVGKFMEATPFVPSHMGPIEGRLINSKLFTTYSKYLTLRVKGEQNVRESTPAYSHYISLLEKAARSGSRQAYTIMHGSLVGPAEDEFVFDDQDQWSDYHDAMSLSPDREDDVDSESNWSGYSGFNSSEDEREEPEMVDEPVFDLVYDDILTVTDEDRLRQQAIDDIDAMLQHLPMDHVDQFNDDADEEMPELVDLDNNHVVNLNDQNEFPPLPGNNQAGPGHPWNH